MNCYECACTLQVKGSPSVQTSGKAFQDILSKNLSSKKINERKKKNLSSKFKVVFTLIDVDTGLLISLGTINRKIQIMIHFSDWLGFHLFEDQLVFQKTNSRVLI